MNYSVGANPCTLPKGKTTGRYLRNLTRLRFLRLLPTDLSQASPILENFQYDNQNTVADDVSFTNMVCKAPLRDMPG
jgi:hypothetical protein